MATVQRGDESITVSSTAIGFTAAELIAAVNSAAVFVESGGPIRYNAVTTPTGDGSEGSPLVYAGSILTVTGSEDLRRIKFIVKTGSGDATLRVLYYGDGRS